MEKRYNIKLGDEIIAKDMTLEIAMIFIESILENCTTYENIRMASIYEIPKE